MIEPSAHASDIPTSTATASPELAAAVRAVIRLSRIVEAASRELSGADYRVLAMISGGEARAARLANRLALGKPAISSTVESLSKRGLVIKESVEGDNRATQLSLSVKGAAVFAKMEARMARQLELLAARTPDPRVTIAALGHLDEVIEASVRSHSAPEPESAP
jgi:DNA-binding MarR family transcriptional regulator